MGVPHFGQRGGAGGGTTIINNGVMGTSEIPSGTVPGTTFSTSKAYTVLWLWLNGLRLHQVGGPPGVGEFSYSGTTITTGDIIQASDWFTATGFTPGIPGSEIPAGVTPGTTFTTSVAYSNPMVYYNGVRQKIVAVAPGIGECTYSGTTLTMGFTVFSDDWLYIEGTV